MVAARLLLASIVATVKSVLSGGSPFAGISALWPTDEVHQGKYVIEAEGIRMAFTNRNGGAPTNLWVKDARGREVDVVLGLDNVTDYDDYRGKLGGTIGRYAGPISNSTFEVDGDTHYTIPNGPANSTWNSGDRGWDQMTFHVGAMTANSITFVLFDRAKTGLPGTCGCSLTHSLFKNEWRITYGVTPTRASKRIPVNLSQKTFFNLDGFQQGGGETIHGQSLYLPFSGTRFDQDRHGIPTGRIKGNIKNAEFDFWSGSEGTVLGNSLERLGVLDNTFLVRRINPWHKDARPVASLRSDRTGIQMDLYTDQEALRVLTWDEGINVTMNHKKAHGGGRVGKNAAISLQMMDWPDAVNHPEWQRDHKMLAGPADVAMFYSRFKFSSA